MMLILSLLEGIKNRFTRGKARGIFYAMTLIRFSVWVQAARPRTLLISFCPVAVGSVVAYSQGAWEPILAVFTLLTAFAIQIGTNLANDYFDFKRGADT